MVGGRALGSEGTCWTLRIKLLFNVCVDGSVSKSVLHVGPAPADPLLSETTGAAVRRSGTLHSVGQQRRDASGSDREPGLYSDPVSLRVSSINS